MAQKFIKATQMIEWSRDRSEDIASIVVQNASWNS